MDQKTQHVLGKISSSIPENLAHNIVRKEVDTSGEEMAKQILASTEISKEGKSAIAKALYDGKLRSEEEVIDEEVIQQIDEHNTREVQRAIEQGALKDPMTDNFYRQRVERSERIAQGKEEPRKVTPLSVEQRREAAERFRFNTSSDPHRRKYY